MHARRLALGVALAMLVPMAVMAPAAPSVAKARTVSARALLSGLTVAPDASTKGYRSKAFPFWVDADRDGCSTRSEVLIAESKRRASTTKSCKVTRGRWTSFVDGKTTTRASAVHVDQIVHVKEAWVSGAYAWSAGTRKAFANDLGYSASLNAISVAADAAKGSRDPASWLPTAARAKCLYAARWVAVKWRWDLNVDSAEKTALAKVLGSCRNADVTVARPKKANVVTAAQAYHAAIENAIVAEVNKARKTAGVKSLKRSSAIVKVARTWSATQALKGDLVHNPSYAKQIPGSWTRAAENIASTTQPGTATEIAKLIVKAWKNSPPHRKTMLSSSYSKTGVGVAFSSSHGWYFTQDFSNG